MAEGQKRALGTYLEVRRLAQAGTADGPPSELGGQTWGQRGTTRGRRHGATCTSVTLFIVFAVR